ncbi:hypothetical protein ANCCAN_10119 [Ancylostoma caninum]|uniref:Carboxylesterase type B domain-containing protein n=1 Tax=Ancylostoma caninum TaxID=29170 RepID=A0A368GJR6_ANCCA|nr:hypothetical protein ANCCAN_10119 [Ancylostoma caninum]
MVWTLIIFHAFPPHPSSLGPQCIQQWWTVRIVISKVTVVAHTSASFISKRYITDRKMEAFHGLDHAFIFSRGYSSNFEIRPFTKRDENMAKILTNMVTNFAKTGDPSTKRFSWPPFSGNKTIEHVSIDLPPKVIQGELHWPNPKFWNVEAELISRHVAADGDAGADPDADLSNEERVQLSAYRRAWWALWLLVAMLAIVVWGIVIYAVVSKGTSPRNKPYDNIVITR